MASMSEEPTAPHNFDYVDRYVSNLPIGMVNNIHTSVAKTIYELIRCTLDREPTEHEAEIITLLGVIFQLSMPNTAQAYEQKGQDAGI